MGGSGQTASQSDPASWVFGAVRFDTRSLALSVDGEPVAVERLPLELLRLLLRHPGEVLDKTQVMEALWPGRVVSESVLPRCVAKLRRALRDDDQQIIRTVHGYGYRFDAPLQRVGDVATPTAGDTPPLRPGWTLVDELLPGLWRARQQETGRVRLYRFVSSPEELTALRDEVDLLGRWHAVIPGFGAVHPVLDWNTEVAPRYLELEAPPAGDAVPPRTLPITPRVLLVEDQAETRERLARAIHAAADLELVAAAANGAEARAAFAAHRPQVVLVDLGLPDGPGSDLIREFCTAEPETLAMVITVFGDEAHVIDAVRAGAVAYLLKDATPGGVARAIRAVCAGGSPISPAVARFLVRTQAHAGAVLGPDEVSLLQQIDQGAAAGVAEEPLPQRIRRIYRKLAE